jgi:hypothetical protein
MMGLLQSKTAPQFQNGIPATSQNTSATIQNTINPAYWARALLSVSISTMIRQKGINYEEG